MKKTSRRRKSPPLPPGITPAMVAAHERRQTGLAAAKDKVLPGPLRAAFAGEPLVVRGHTFQPITAGTLALLERINSPLPPMIKLAAQNPGLPPEALAAKIDAQLKPDPEAFIETVWLMVTPLAEVRKRLAAGRPAFREHVLTTFADQLPPVHMAELQQAAALHFVASFATAVKYETEPDATAGFPSPSALNQTALVGGSTTSAS